MPSVSVVVGGGKKKETVHIVNPNTTEFPTSIWTPPKKKLNVENANNKPNFTLNTLNLDQSVMEQTLEPASQSTLVVEY